MVEIITENLNALFSLLAMMAAVFVAVVAVIIADFSIVAVSVIVVGMMPTGSCATSTILLVVVELLFG
jgi:hypothetical protein